jgi:hypothetical protein
VLRIALLWDDVCCRPLKGQILASSLQALNGRVLKGVDVLQALKGREPEGVDGRLLQALKGRFLGAENGLLTQGVEALHESTTKLMAGLEICIRVDIVSIKLACIACWSDRGKRKKLPPVE